jgi:predicted transcriptional regulator
MKYDMLTYTFDGVRGETLDKKPDWKETLAMIMFIKNKNWVKTREYTPGKDPVVKEYLLNLTLKEV